MKNVILKNLTRSDKFNVRKTDKDKNLEELISSIKNHGLLENLLVIKGKKNKFEVVAGGRRLLALQKLQKEGFLKDDYEVPCEIVSKKDAEEISLAENSIRSQMHPADQFEAFAKLYNNGMSIADIAARFGTSDSIVEKRLKLGKLSPVLMKAYRDNEIELEVLMAYTLSDDHKKQEEVFKATKDNWEGRQPRTIRKYLTETSVSATEGIVMFIGIEAYEKAGGTIRRDLFSEDDELYLEDLNLVHELAQAKLQEKADELKEKWSWVETSLSISYTDLDKFDSYHPTNYPVPEDILERHDELINILTETERELGDESEEYKKYQQEYIELNEKIDSYRRFKDFEYQTSGCIVSISYGGELRIEEGLIRPEDKKKIKELQKKEGNSEDEISIPSNDYEPSAYSQSLTDRLKNYRLHPVKMAVAGNFDASFDLILYSMCTDLFRSVNGCYYSYHECLGLSAIKYNYPMQLSSDDETCSKMEQEEDKYFSELPLSWLNIEDKKEQFEAFCDLSEEAKQQLFASCTALMLKPKLSNESYSSDIFEAVKNRLEVDVSDSWRPNSSNFLERVTKAQLLDLAEELISKEWADKHKSKKKGELVGVMNEAFNGSQKEFSDEQKQRINSWLPEGM